MIRQTLVVVATLLATLASPLRGEEEDLASRLPPGTAFYLETNGLDDAGRILADAKQGIARIPGGTWIWDALITPLLGPIGRIETEFSGGSRMSLFEETSGKAVLAWIRPDGSRAGSFALGIRATSGVEYHVAAAREASSRSEGPRIWSARRGEYRWFSDDPSLVAGSTIEETGGIRFEYELPSDLERTIRIEQERLARAGYDSQVRALGADRFEVSVAGATEADRETLESTLGTGGKIEFVLAAGVEFESDQWLEFEPLSTLVPGDAGYEDRRAYEIRLAQEGVAHGDRVRGFRWARWAAEGARRDGDFAPRPYRLLVLWETVDSGERVPIETFGSADIERIGLETMPEFRPTFEMTDERSRAFEEFTSEHKNEPLAILFDDEVLSAPTIQEQIAGRGILTGFAPSFARALPALFQAGELPSRPRLIAANVVAPSAPPTSESLADRADFRRAREEVHASNKDTFLYADVVELAKGSRLSWAASRLPAGIFALGFDPGTPASMEVHATARTSDDD